ncbi:hypothetical protein CDD83_7987 [Cordyceps sp. RAO-2017]|nr:hypothetical protein CDD83_7987 [Cordyceps sp. RAO-2017]
MRLLSVSSLHLTTFMGADEDIPPYAIVSHTWDDAEVTFEDIRAHRSKLDLLESPQFDKIRHSCARAAEDGLDYVWIDTCCIDTGSSSELSEAINSMFKWYQQSAVCYVYLKDFETREQPPDPESKPHRRRHIPEEDEEFCSSRWFNRGWTLQELIAPRSVLFFDKNWVEFGGRDNSLFRRICARTGILPQVFTSRHCMCSTKPLLSLRNGRCLACNASDNLSDILGSLNASVIMGWAANRSTTRREDVAYCLMGLFNVNMPLLYGEGDKAFMRLQAAILERSSDHSLLLWRAKPDRYGVALRPGCLARSPKAFEYAPPIVPQRDYYDFDNEMMPRLAARVADNIEPMKVSEALTITLWLCPCRVGHPFDVGDEGSDTYEWTLGILNCNGASDYLVRPAILLAQMGDGLFRRIACDAIFLVNPRSQLSAPVTTLSLYHRHPNTPDPKAYWAVVKQISMEKVLRKKIKLLVRPSGPTSCLLRSVVRTYDRASSSSDAVCCVLNQPQRGSLKAVTASIVGSYPTIGDGLGLIGGIHRLELAVPEASLKVEVVVIWGLQYDDSALHNGLDREPAGKPWCRLFHCKSFTNDSKIPLREQEEGDSRYQKRLYTWLAKSSTDPDWQVIDERGCPKKVLPHLARDKAWPAADRMLDLFSDPMTKVGLSARMNIVRGFGITSNDIELTFLTPQCTGWQSRHFDGSRQDQKPCPGSS